MKELIVCISILLISFISHSQEKQYAKVEEVALFTRGAQIVRKANVSVLSGESTLIFTGLSPHLDEASVKVKGAGDFTILSVSSQKNFLSKKELEGTLGILNDSLEHIEETIALTEMDLTNVQNQLSFLEKNKEIKGDAGINKADLQAIGEYYYSEIQKFHRIRFYKAKELVDLEEEQDRVKRQMEQKIRKSAEIDGEILVEILSESSTHGEFEISYYVPNAGWYPSYDIHVNDLDQPVSVIHYVNMFQRTGEDWDKVDISFSNGNPNQNTQIPDLPIYYISEGAYQRGSYKRPPGIHKVFGIVTDHEGEPLIGASIILEGTTVGMVTDFNGKFSMNISSQGDYLNIAYVGYESQQVPIGHNRIQVRMVESSHLLDEVVVTGFGAEASDLLQRERKRQEFEEIYIPQRKVDLHSTINSSFADD